MESASSVRCFISVRLRVQIGREIRHDRGLAPRSCFGLKSGFEVHLRGIRGLQFPPLKRSFQLRVGGCDSHSVKCDKSVVTIPFGHTERCSDLTFEAKRVHCRTEPGLTAHCKLGPSPRGGRGTFTLHPFTRRHTIGPIEGQSRNRRRTPQDENVEGRTKWLKQ